MPEVRQNQYQEGKGYLYCAGLPFFKNWCLFSNQNLHLLLVCIFFFADQYALTVRRDEQRL